MEAIKHAANRGQLLTLLKPEYPEFVDFIVLRRVMANLNKPLTDDDLAKYLYYLSEAGYVELKKDKNQYILCAKLTKQGLDLLDKWSSDPAVLVE